MGIFVSSAIPNTTKKITMHKNLSYIDPDNNEHHIVLSDSESNSSRIFHSFVDGKYKPIDVSKLIPKCSEVKFPDMQLLDCPVCKKHLTIEERIDVDEYRCKKSYTHKYRLRPTVDCPCCSMFINDGKGYWEWSKVACIDMYYENIYHYLVWYCGYTWDEASRYCDGYGSDEDDKFQEYLSAIREEEYQESKWEMLR